MVRRCFPITCNSSQQPMGVRAFMRSISSRRVVRPRGTFSRAGAILVWFAILLPLLLGMVGLVIDVGLLLTAHRQLQTSVDAAAMASADLLLRGGTSADARSLATEFVSKHHGVANAEIQIHIPPEAGPFAGQPDHVEVIASSKAATIFIHVLGGNTTRTATARAVAGSHGVESIDGVIALDPDAKPGVAVTGNAHLTVSGRLMINSEGGGVDASGTAVTTGSGVSAAFVSAFGSITATQVRVVGGASRPERFFNYEAGGENPLKTGQLPVPDPFLNLPVPSVATGVIDVRRGAPRATKSELLLNNDDDTSDTPNYLTIDGLTGEVTMVLQPGIYSQIDISGGNVRFEPGIYVVAASDQQPYSIAITGGTIEAQGIMFYNTSDDYDPISGMPDAADGSRAPSPSDGSTRQILLNAYLGFSPINTAQNAYPGATGIATYNGMLIFQRRQNRGIIQIQGFAEDGKLSGAVYAKWARVNLPLGGVFRSQFVVGSLRVPGHGDLTIDYAGLDLIEAPQLFLVE